MAKPLEPGLEAYPGCRLVQRIGAGGFAEVWQAKAPNGKTVALKFLPCDSSHDSVTELRSLQAIRALSHPNLIRIFGVWSNLGYIIVSMEVAEGSLADLLEAYQTEYGSAIPREQVYLLLTQAAEALDFLNKRQHDFGGAQVAIQHCDVKPSNFLLFGDTVKLSDFGLASSISCQLQGHRRAGTLAYTAPEVFQGRLSDWTDQFSLGVTYCELRSGRLPYAQVPSSFQGDYVRPQPDLSMLPAPERPIVARALAAVPHARWPSCSAFINQLFPYLTEAA